MCLYGTLVLPFYFSFIYLAIIDHHRNFLAITELLESIFEYPWSKETPSLVEMDNSDLVAKTKFIRYDNNEMRNVKENYYGYPKLTY